MIVICVVLLDLIRSRVMCVCVHLLMSRLCFNRDGRQESLVCSFPGFLSRFSSPESQDQGKQALATRRVRMGLLRRLSSTPSRRKSSEPDSPPTKTDAPDSKVPEGAAQEAAPMGIEVEGATATMTLYLQKKNGRLGISIDDDNFVHDVDEGSAGQEAGFCIGDWVSCQHTSPFPVHPWV